MAEEIDFDKLDISDEMIAERRADPGVLPDDMNPLMKKIIGSIDIFTNWVGKVVSWMVLIMVGVVMIEVVGRNLFAYLADLDMVAFAHSWNIGPTDFAYDVSRWTCGWMFMMGAAYALSRGVHIRADFIYRNFSVKKQATCDFALYLIFFFPSLILFTWVSGEYYFDAWNSEERSMDTAWMQVLWPVYSCLPLGGLLLIVQGISETLKCVYAMQKGEWP